MPRNSTDRARFLFSTEEECLTALPDRPEQLGAAMERFLAAGRRTAPSLPCSAGYFNAFGRNYIDVGHVELAAAECDDPVLLAHVVEKQHILAVRAVRELERLGDRLLLANNNHSGRLQRGCPVWGTHENYLTELHPTEFGALILPFLVTRIYAGAGGVLFPDGAYLAGTRPICMELSTGGDTTRQRAIHSTARNEHHMGPSPTRYRYHLILGDGHRSHWNLAVQFGATALALKAVIYDAQLPRDLQKLNAFPPQSNDWVGLLRRFNVLIHPGQCLAVDPIVIDTQRVYLSAARRFAATLDHAPIWIPRILEDWQQMLDAFARLDHGWLAARLDAFIKYHLMTSFLNQAGASWAELPRRTDCFNKLALLNQSYHAFCRPDSAFTRLDEAGVLAHRVGDVSEPGDEPDPFVFETATRARTRAQLIRDHQHDPDLVVDWQCVRDPQRGRYRELFDPFAESYGPWQHDEQHWRGLRHFRHLRTTELLSSVRRAYEQGDYPTANRRLSRLEALHRAIPTESNAEVIRYRALIQARRGQLDAATWLERAYGDTPRDLVAMTDFCCAHRFGSLAPNEEMQHCVERGREMLSTCAGEENPAVKLALREHLADALLRGGRAQEALEILETTLRNWNAPEPWLFGRCLATLGDVYRTLGNRPAARRTLRNALNHHARSDTPGDRADFTWTYLAKLETWRRRALGWIVQAIEVQTATSNRVGLARSRVLEARLSGRPDVAARNRQEILLHQQHAPALARCRKLAVVLEHWDRWIDGAMLDGVRDPFWNV